MLSVFFVVSLLLMLVIGFLTLSACGHVLIGIGALREDIVASVKEVQFQSRVTRKMLREDFDTRLYPTVGFHYPPPSQLQVALDHLERGEEPVIDFSQIGRK
jgi:hypothetical protein